MKVLWAWLWAWLWCCSSYGVVSARNFSICREFAGNDFFDNFYFWKYNDPTKGKVDYVSRKVAQDMNLSYVDPANNRFVMQVDHMNEAVPLNGNQSDLGRRSVRIHSNNLYGDGVYILKASFMPQGCGTWPAFWSDGPSDWPSGGEIDIIEGVNGEGGNIASLHTAEACQVPNVTQLQQGSVMITDSATKQAPTNMDLGDAMQRWGKPQAFFGSDTGDASNGTNCPMNQIFQNHELVFDTT
ncbi:hypothetical protein MYAM1_001934 [Malassezia yamatoensis]|uniref:GH16 domain-containing protein n=1 Tax=Malassezia yamatoensis TaxID=253288 RepID=A0AAJ6CHC2_9BASI|nr:hypothetical protein MYAM1_001934 [Malassezia yamatoensis]